MPYEVETPRTPEQKLERYVARKVGQRHRRSPLTWILVLAVPFMSIVSTQVFSGSIVWVFVILLLGGGIAIFDVVRSLRLMKQYTQEEREIAMRDKPCLHCSYPLAAIPSENCPECGTPRDLR